MRARPSARSHPIPRTGQEAAGEDEEEEDKEEEEEEEEEEDARCGALILTAR